MSTVTETIAAAFSGKDELIRDTLECTSKPLLIVDGTLATFFQTGKLSRVN